MRFPFAAAADAERTARRREGRARRYALRTRLRTSGIAGKRQALCGYAVHGGNDTGEVTLRRSAAGVASYGGLQTCELIWLCPVCSAAERSRRAGELEAAAKAHLAAGGGLVFVTATLPHDADDALTDTLDAVLNGWRTVQRTAAWKAVKALGLLGFARAVEITDGRNGWHPHLHSLLFVARPATAGELLQLERSLGSAWQVAIAAAGFRTPSDAHGLRVQPVHLGGAEALAQYLTKVQDGFGTGRDVAVELLRGDLKRGRKGSRTPFEIAEAAVAGDEAARLRWDEYVQATARRKAMHLSPAVREAYALDVEFAREVLAQEGGQEVGALDPAAWALVVRQHRQAWLLDRLEVAGVQAVHESVAAMFRRQALDRRLQERRRR